jgi:hypothetical protein
MPKVHPITPSMNTGELTPRLAARVDFNKYPSGLATMENLIPLPEGGAMRRSGTRYVAATKTGATIKSRLKKFEFSTTQNYILEMGTNYMRFFRNQGQITVPNITASITNGTFPSGISSWTDRSGSGSSIAHDATNDRLSLVSNGTTTASAEQVVTNSSAIEHVIQFQVIGAPGDYAFFRVGTASTGTQIVNDFIAEVGYHCYSFTATAANFYVQFLSEQAKTVQIDNVALLDNAPVELVTPYAEADLYQIEGPQSADILYMFHASYPTYRLERRGHTTWSLIEVPWQDGPWLPANDTTTTFTCNAATGLGKTLTASSTTGINGGAGFTSNDIGRSFRLTDNTTTNWGWGVITAITDTTTCTVDIDRTVTVTTAETDWRLGSWSATTGYPSTGAFFEQRLYAAGNTDQPQTFWASQTGDFENHGPDSDPTAGTYDGTVQDDDALDFTISADNVNAIRWMSAGEDTLSIGTTGGEWIPSSTGAVITPSDVAVRRQTTHGSAQVIPVRVDNIVLFAQRAKRKIREFGFTFETDGYRAFDMTRLAQHITVSGIVEMDHAEEPDSQVWVVRGDGQLPAMTFRRQEDVVGWARHISGGHFGQVTVTVTDYTNIAVGTTLILTKSDGESITFTSEATSGSAPAETLGFRPNESNDTTADNIYTAVNAHADFTVANPGANIVIIEETTHGATGLLTIASSDPVRLAVASEGHSIVESVAVIAGADGAGQTHDSTNRDEVWLQIKRTIDGATTRYVEFLERDYDDSQDAEDAVYSDSCITYDGTSATIITGLSHLEGETVKVWGDSAIQADKTVSSGSITLETAAKVVQIGLGYPHKIKTLKIADGNKAGTAVGKTKRINGVTFVMLNSHTIEYGPSSSDLTKNDFREVSDAMDLATPLFTGELFVEFDGNWGSDPRIFIESDDAAPFTVLAIAPEVKINALK